MHHVLMMERQHKLNSNMLLKRFGINHLVWVVLVRVAERPGISIGDLAATIAFERSNLSRIVEKAEKRGLVLRAIETRDRRRSRILLTANGRKMIEKCKPLILGLYEHYLSNFAPGEFEQFMQTLLRMRRNVDLEGLKISKERSIGH